jgi:hypothetical protein
MGVSQYIRDNYSHSTTSYGLDDDEDFITTQGVGRQHKKVNDPSLEIDDETDEGIDIGTERQQWRVNNEYSEVNEEDGLVNNGTYKPDLFRKRFEMSESMREWLNSDDDDYQDFNTEDDDE